MTIQNNKLVNQEKKKRNLLSVEATNTTIQTTEYNRVTTSFMLLIY